MKLLSNIVHDTYNKYQAKATEHGISIDLDIRHPSLKIKNYQNVEQQLNKCIETIIHRQKTGNIHISTTESHIIVKDSSITLTPDQRMELSSIFDEIKSRVGFGTIIKIHLETLELF